MRSGEKRAVALGEIKGLDLLRARVELAVAPPAVIAVTSATAGDGREIAAQGLAYSLATAGYSTLFVDTALVSRTLAALPRGLGIEEIGRQQLSPGPGNGRLAVLTLNDVTLQQTTSIRGMRAAVEILRCKFDYVVVSTDFGMSTAFGAALATTADAVLVSLKTGRRKTAADDELAAALELIGSRFSGIVAVRPSVIEPEVTGAVPDAAALGGRRRTALAWIAPFARALSAGNALRLAPAPQTPNRSEVLAPPTSSFRG